MSSVAQGLDAGTILAERFVVQSSIAPGLYRAFDRTLGRLVALQLVDPRAVRERGEAIRSAVRAARLVLHPNVVLFHEFHDDPPPFYATELLYGETLEARLRRIGHLGADEVASLVESLGGALAAIHDAGIAHGQLRPRDIVIRSDGSAVIALPALARVATPLHREEHTEDLVYIAPEARGGEPQMPSDLYSLGAVCYHGLYGQPPPLDPRLPDISLSTTSLQMARLIGRCMDPQPGSRPTARQIAAEARQAPPSPMSSLDADISMVRRVPRRSPSSLVPAAMGVLALAAVAGAALWIGRARQSTARTSLSVGGMTMSVESGWGETAFRRLLRNALANDRRFALTPRADAPPDISVEGAIELRGETAQALLRVRPAHTDPFELACSGRGLLGAAARCAEQLTSRLVAGHSDPAPDQRERREMAEAGITTLPGYQAYLQAQHAISRSDWSVGVSDAFLKLSRLEPDCPLGIDPVWTESQSGDQAMAKVEELTRKLPPGPPRTFAEIDIAFWKRDLDRVRTLAREVQTRAPESALVHEAVVNALLHLGLRTEARAFGEEALRRHPDWTPLWDEVLGLYEGDDLRAEMARRFVEAQPELTLSHLVAAKTFIAIGRPKDAVEEYRRAELLAPDDSQVVEGRAALEAQEERFAESERYARRLLTLGADGEVQGYLWLGNLKALRGRFGDAFNFWQRGDEVSARRPTGWSQSAIICAMSSRRNRVLTALELGDREHLGPAAHSLASWVRMRPWNLGYQASGYMLAEIAKWRLGQLDRAGLDKFIDGYAADPKHAVTPALLGMVRVVEAALMHDSHTGMQAARELADVAGPAEEYAAGVAMLDSGELHSAETRFKEVAQKPFADTERAFKMMSPYHRIHALYRLAQVYEREKHPTEARELYRRFVAAWGDADRELPDVADARKKLGE